MLTLDRRWPQSFPCVRRPVATVVTPRNTRQAWQEIDALALRQAHLRQSRENAVQCTGLVGGIYNEDFFVQTGSASAVSATAAEASLLAGVNLQPFLTAGWMNRQGGQANGFSVFAHGVLSTTSTPTIIFQLRLGTTSGSTFLSGTSVGVTAAITTAGGVTNKYWQLHAHYVCTTPGIGTNNATLTGAGFVASPGGFASPFTYAVEPTTPDTATWSSTIDASLTQFLNLSVTWSASSASNTITCKQLICSTHG